MLFDLRTHSMLESSPAEPKYYHMIHVTFHEPKRLSGGSKPGNRWLTGWLTIWKCLFTSDYLFTCCCKIVPTFPGTEILLQEAIGFDLVCSINGVSISPLISTFSDINVYQTHSKWLKNEKKCQINFNPIRIYRKYEVNNEHCRT